MVNSMNQDFSTPAGAWGQCYNASEDLFRLMAQHGQHAMLVQTQGSTYPGREHWALYVGSDIDEGYVIDLTARQFDSTAQFPLVASLDDWLDLVVDWQADNVDWCLNEVVIGRAGWFDMFVRYHDSTSRDDVDHEVEPMRAGLVVAAS